MLMADEALEPTVLTRSKPGVPSWYSERMFSSLAAAEPGRRAKGFRIGMALFETGAREMCL